MAYLKREKCNRFIITDEKKRPMTWSKHDEQLCYSDSFCNDTDGHPHFVLETYSYQTAVKHIKKSQSNRKKWGYKEPKYELMPIFARY